MKIQTSLLHKDASALLEIVGKHWLAHTIFEWEQFWGKWNCINFNVIQISAEQDIALPGFEFVFIILGCGFRIRINYDWSTTKTGRSLLDFMLARDTGTLEHVEDDCPRCYGTGKVSVTCVKGTCNNCGYRPEDCECTDDDEHFECGSNCYEC